MDVEEQQIVFAMSVQPFVSVSAVDRVIGRKAPTVALPGGRLRRVLIRRTREVNGDGQLMAHRIIFRRRSN
jgi:hypothetical protein